MRGSIIHVHKGLSADDWSHNYINIMPAGTYSVANYAIECGHDVNVLNASVFKDREDAFENIFAAIEDNNSEVVGIPFHWHFTGDDVIYAAGRIKERCAGVKTVIGGISASILGEDVMRVCPAIDAVVHGDGEVPFAQYLHQLDRGVADCNLANVPNLRWRNGPNIVFNGISYAASQTQYSSFDFGISKTVQDLRQYPKGWTMVDAVAGHIRDLQAETVGQKVFFVNLGRGCSYNCVHCAGSNVMFRKYFGRREPVVRSADAVLRTVRDAYGLGFREYHFCWDCAFPNKKTYLRTLFSRMRQEIGDDISLIYEIYKLPSKEFIELCSRSFQRCVLILSPNYFEHKNRCRYMGFSYTNEQLESCLQIIGKYQNCTPFVYFGITPLEDWSDSGLVPKIALMKKLKSKYGCKVSAMPIYAEPGSPWVSFPEVFGTHIFQLSFTDFHNEWCKPLNPWNDGLSGVDNTGEIVMLLEGALGIDKML